MEPIYSSSDDFEELETIIHMICVLKNPHCFQDTGWMLNVPRAEMDAALSHLEYLFNDWMRTHKS